MKRQQLVKYCDRCPLGKKPTPATRTIPFGFGDTVWEIDVCDKHGDMLERELYAWGMMGRSIEDASITAGGARRFTQDYSENARRLAELRTAQATADREAAEAAREAGTGARQVLAEAGRPAQLAAPHDAGDWVFSEHALERMEQRNIKALEAIWAASAPTVKHPGNRRHLMVHERDGIKAVVNPKNRVIITVGADKRDEAFAQ